MFQTFSIHFSYIYFIDNIRKIEVCNTLTFWKTETQTETENHVIYTHAKRSKDVFHGVRHYTESLLSVKIATQITYINRYKLLLYD